MLNLKKVYSNELLQLALLLSLLRVDPESYLGLDMLTIGIGSLDLNNGSGWHTDAQTIVHRPMFVHPKNLDSVLLNYERDLFEDLNTLGRYNRINGVNNDIQAYLLNVEDKNEEPGTSSTESNSTSDGQGDDPDPPTDSQTTDEPSRAADLTQEDMELIESLWKQDEDMGLTLADFLPKNDEIIYENELVEDDIEKLKLQALNDANSEKKDESEEESAKKDDPWNGLAYTVDVETGEYILSSGASSSKESSTPSDQAQVQQQEPAEAQTEREDPESGFSPSSSSPSSSSLDFIKEDQLEAGQTDLIQLAEDSLSLDLDNDFDSLLESTEVEAFLNYDSIGLNNVFNLGEALQLIDLDDAELEKKKELKDRKSNTEEEIENNTTDEEENPKEGDMSVIHQAPFPYHPHHSPHHARFHQRMAPWTDTRSPLIQVAGNPEHFSHSSYPVFNSGHSQYEVQSLRNHVLYNNASLAAPVDHNATANYHNGGPSNLGSAVATSMNLTNSTEPLCAENAGVYKSEPLDMNYFHQNQNAILPDSITPDFNLFTYDDLTFGDLPISENSLNNASFGASSTGPVVQNHHHHHQHHQQHQGATASAAGTNLMPLPDERMDASSDSAVSSMGSERVASLSDGGEWMETGSNSSQTPADSHYAMGMDYKYRVPSYDCSYAVPGQQRCHPGTTPMEASARKKYKFYGKRCMQDPPLAPSPLTAAPHPATTSIKYEYDSAQGLAVAPPGNAYSGPIEGAAGPHSKIKYSYGLDYQRHQTGRAIEQIHHNHTYNMPPESSAPLQRTLSRDKKARKGDSDDQHLSRDEKRARSLNVPIAVNDIINLPMDEFNERLSKYDLSEAQLSLIRDIRRRGKNKVAAQNCRKRKLDQILSLADQVKEMRDRKMRLLSERNYMLQEKARVKEKFSQLYRHVMQALRDPNGNPYNPAEWSLQLSADGNVVLVPRSNQSSNHYNRSLMDSKGKPNHEHKE